MIGSRRCRERSLVIWTERESPFSHTPYGPNKCKLHLITGVQLGELARITGWFHPQNSCLPCVYTSEQVLYSKSPVFSRRYKTIHLSRSLSFTLNGFYSLYSYTKNTYQTNE
jgi:hypothetical protein